MRYSTPLPPGSGEVKVSITQDSQQLFSSSEVLVAHTGTLFITGTLHRPATVGRGSITLLVYMVEAERPRWDDQLAWASREVAPRHPTFLSLHRCPVALWVNATQVSFAVQYSTELPPGAGMLKVLIRQADSTQLYRTQRILEGFDGEMTLIATLRRHASLESGGVDVLVYVRGCPCQPALGTK